MADETASIWRDIGLLHALSGNLSGAIAALHRSVEGKRTPADTWLHLGEALFAQGKPDLAQRMWRTCVEKSRSKKAAYYHLALARLEEGH
jgi:tetratricopeptide (TPR) repeat protein